MKAATGGTLLDPGLRPAGRFFGREAELEAVNSWIATPDVPVLTIWGSGGMGKSRLVREALARSADAGTLPRLLFARLEDVTSATDVYERVLAAADVVMPPTRDRAAERVALRLGEWKGELIVLDGAEGRPTTVAELIAELLVARPSLRVLVTSQVVLGLRSERVLALDGLATTVVGGSGPSSPAAALFAERVAQTQPGWTPSATDLREMERLVLRLDGVPLCVEMAASQLGVSDVRELATRLDLPQRLALDAPDVPARQRSVEAMLAWTWDRLPDDARGVLAAISVLAGEFRLPAAVAIVARPEAEVRRGLDLLRRHALVATETDAEDGVRFRLRSMVRAFGLARLAPEDADATWRRSAEYHKARFTEMFVRHLATGAPELRRALLVEYESARGIFEWATRRGDDELAAAAAMLVCGPLIWRGLHAEAIALAERALRSHPGASPLLRGALELRRVFAVLELEPDAADLDELESLAARVEANPTSSAYALRALGAAARHHGDAARAVAADTRGLALGSTLGPRFRMKALLALAASRLQAGTLQGLGAELEEAISLARAQEDVASRALGLELVAELHARRGELAEAERVLGSVAGLSGPGAVLQAEVALAQGALAVAQTRLDALRARIQGEGPRWLVGPVALIAAQLAFEQGRSPRAAELIDDARRSLEERAPPHVEAHAAALRAGVLASLQRVEAAATALERALARDRQGSPYVAVARLQVGLAQPVDAARRAELAREAAALAEHLSSDFGAGGGPALAGVMAARQLRRTLAIAAPADADRLTFERSSGRAVVGSRTIELGRRATLRRVLAALIERRDGAPMTVDEIFEAGWPGESATPAAISNRVYNALSTLRGLGLGALVEGAPDGYRIGRPAAWVVRE